MLTKTDSVSQQNLKRSADTAKAHCEKLICFSSDSKRKEQSLADLQNALAATIGLKGKYVLVAGKALTGKHTLITALAKAAKCYQEDPLELQTFKLHDGLYLIDSPFKIEDSTAHPMFTVPNPVLEDVSLQAQEEQLIRKLFIGEEKQPALLERDGVL